MIEGWKAALVGAGVMAMVGCATKLGPITPGTLRVISGSEIPLADRKDMLSRKDDEDWMLLTFSSDDDYLAIAQRKEMNVFVNEALCTDGRMLRDIMSSSIHAGPPPASLVDVGPTTGAPPKRFVYRTYVAMTAPKRAVAGADPGPAAGYDLRSDPHDLCIQVQGGNMAGMTAASGIAVFPRALVESAIAPSHASP